MENTNKLPENWVIDTLKEKDSELMPKFMDWFEENKTIEKGISKYLGRWGNHISDWKNNNLTSPIITLEQWNEAYFPEWQPKQGERVLVRDNESHEWQERVFVVKNRGAYYCEGDVNKSALYKWGKIKPIPKESQLQPKIDELKSEAERLGLKIEIIIS